MTVPKFNTYNNKLTGILILRKICEEKTTEQIAKEIGLTRGTIDGYIRALKNLSKTNSFVDLALFAIKEDVYRVEIKKQEILQNK